MTLPDWLPPGEPMSDKEFAVWLKEQKHRRHITDIPEQRAHVTLPTDSDGPVLPPSWGLVDGKPFTMPLPVGRPLPSLPESWKLPPELRGVPPSEDQENQI